jgi:phenylacetate-CoA ligase
MKPSFQERRANTLALLREYRILETAPAGEHDAIAARKLGRLLKHSSASGWWRSHLAIKTQTEPLPSPISSMLGSLPTLSRATIQQELDWMRIWIPGSKPADYVELSTSGSTGQPIKIKQYLPAYQLHYGALELLDTQWSERDLNQNLGFFRISEPPALERPIGEPFNYLGFKGSIISKKLVGSHPREILETMAAHNVRYASLNAMAIRVLAIEQLKQPVKNLNLEHFLSWADPVTNELRDLVQQAFKARIVDRYSSNEFGFLAIQCPVENHLHSPQVNNFIEIVDDENQPLPAGEQGRVLVTALNNFSQPMIRYELGDIASWGEGCQAGITYPILKPGIVRQRDMHLDSEGKMRIPHPDGISAIKSGLVSRYQIFRFSASLVILAGLTRQASNFEIEEIKNQLREQFSLELVTKFVELPESLEPLLHSWKNRRVIVINSPEPTSLSAQNLIDLIPKLGQRN